MATVHLRQDEVDNQHLPGLCLCCGEPATVFRKKEFTWFPKWIIIFLIYSFPLGLILGVLLSRHMRVRVPLCQRHQYHWILRLTYLLGGFFICLILVLALIFLFDAPVGSRLRNVAGPSVAIICVLWIASAAALLNSTVRATEITERGITLSNVADEFVTALHAGRETQHILRVGSLWKEREADTQNKEGIKPSDDERISGTREEDEKMRER